MKTDDLKKLIIDSLDSSDDMSQNAAKIYEASGSFDFKAGFGDRVLEKLSLPVGKVIRDFDFTRSMNIAFYRIALTGVAAIVLLLISNFLSEGSLSLNTFLGMGESYDESIVYLLTGN